ncbi:Uncharacterised protein [Mycobacteroides abscessus]|nr:Uncharacterised protein [Mycobacteroides abscessus]SKV20425.1 Uncharacterised protein [Mycobacteroides abscessus subsp. abscessus]SKV87960.1 Uncharacterised protein [Mycobacteroides abscessus subsp. abscessus]
MFDAAPLNRLPYCCVSRSEIGVRAGVTKPLYSGVRALASSTVGSGIPSAVLIKPETVIS